MKDVETLTGPAGPAAVFVSEDETEAAAAARPIWLATRAQAASPPPELGPSARRWLAAAGFSGAPKQHVLVPGKDGRIAGAAFGLGGTASGEPSGPSELLAGQLPQCLPPGDYRLLSCGSNGELAAIAWGLGAYRFSRYKPIPSKPARLVMPEGANREAVVQIVEAIWHGRDLINTPASDLGPEEIEVAIRLAGTCHGATVEAIVGDDLISRGFPMIHAVGRASSRAPRLIDLVWGRPDAPAVTLVGKGISFDTGGLDIKTASGMLLMKKDMGGAASALALARMIMASKLDVRLRLLVPAAENSISGNAFRPGDILASRAGVTVEVGNTDAEGRLVLADALALASEDEPRLIAVFATLTGAARAALGPELPALFTDDDELAASLQAISLRVGDPVWRLPFWKGYERHLDSEQADICNAPNESPFAGAITAALFLRRFVHSTRRFMHLDMYGWSPGTRPLGPKGGEPQGARAVFELLKKDFEV